MKYIGAVLILFSCGWVGFSYAAVHRKEETNLRQLIAVLDFMECELQYHHTSLPCLCIQAAKEGTGLVHRIFGHLASELESQIAPNVSSCMKAAMLQVKGIPPVTENALHTLGQSLGRFDLSGQLTGLESVRQHCRQALEKLANNRDSRLRSYQTLGICAGAALVILFI